MKRSLAILSTLTIFACFGAATLASAQTDADRTRALEYLEKTRAGVMESTKGLSEAQINAVFDSRL